MVLSRTLARARSAAAPLLAIAMTVVASCYGNFPASPGPAEGSGGAGGAGGTGTGGTTTTGTGGTGTATTGTGGGATGGGTPDAGGGGGPPAPATFAIGAATADITPPAVGAVPDPSVFAGCDPKYNGPRTFAFEEPYIDSAGAGHYVSGDDYCDANGNGRYDGIFLGGGSGIARFPVQILDPISARAVVFGTSDAMHHVALVSVDSVGLMNPTDQAIAALATTLRPVLEQVVVSSTHDESAPDPVGLWGPDQGSCGVNDYYLTFLVQQAAGAVASAFDQAEPAHLVFARAAQPPEFRPVWSSYPFIHDPTIMVMQGVSASDASHVIFTLANYNFHAEGYGFSPDGVLSTSLSADWPGVYRTAIEARYGGVGFALSGLVGSVETPQVFPAGGVPQTPVSPPFSNPGGAYSIYAPGSGEPLTPGTVLEANTIGIAVAEAAADALVAAGPDQWSRSGQVRSVLTGICLEVENQYFLEAIMLGIIDRPLGCGGSMTAAPSQLAVLDVGDAQMATVPGEVFPLTVDRGFFGIDDMPFASEPMTPWVSAAMTGKYTFYAGLSEDMTGYIMPAANFVGETGEITTDPWLTWDMTMPETDRFGYQHGDDGESLGPSVGGVVANGLIAAIQMLDPAGPAATSTATGRYVDASGNIARSPFPATGFSGAVGVWVLPAGSTTFTPGTGSIYTLAANPTVGSQTATGTIGGFIDLHGLPETAGYTVGTRGVWIAASGGTVQRIFVDVLPGM
jgi:hypothetical protein